MDKPLVSIVIPVYNGSNYLKEAIDSALNQTYKNCEVIVVNDGSQDNGATERIALEYGSRIRYFYKENGGVATAVNMGIQNMRGEYFAWLSHDDYYYPDKVEQQVAAVLQCGDPTAIVHSNYDTLDMETGRLTRVNWLKQWTREQLTCGSFAPVFLCIHGCSILIHKSHFERVGLYDESLIATQDSVFLFKVMRGQKSVFVEESLFVARHHGEQGSRLLACHKSECNQMFHMFCDELTNDEKRLLCGSVYNFYYQMYVVLKGDERAGDIVPRLRGKIDAGPAIGNEVFYRRLEELLQMDIDIIKRLDVCLFGAGDSGRRMVNDLTLRGIKVRNFIDNNRQKWDRKIYGVPCCGMVGIEPQKDTVLVIITILAEDEVYQQLKERQVPYVVKYSDIVKTLFGGETSCEMA